MRNILLIIVILTAACSQAPDDRGPTGLAVPPLLSTLADLARDSQDSVADDAGFVDTAHCDSLQHSGLIAAAGVPVDMRAAELEPGRWLRRPTSHPECWAAGESRSTISRDQLLGVLWWAWTIKDAQAVRDLWNYGEANTWRMGEGRYNGLDTVLSYNDVILLARLCMRLEADCGSNSRKFQFFSPLFMGTPVGFERHLEILRIMLFWEIDGHAPYNGMERLNQHALEQLWNPLPVAALAARGLADPDQVDQRIKALGYPDDRLPASQDWCSHWVVETEDGSDPCPNEAHTHSAGEILFMWRLFNPK